MTVYRKLYGRGEAEPYNRICDEAKPSYILKVYGHFWDMEPYYTPTDFHIQCFNELPFHHSTLELYTQNARILYKFSCSFIKTFSLKFEVTVYRKLYGRNNHSRRGIMYIIKLLRVFLKAISFDILLALGEGAEYEDLFNTLSQRKRLVLQRTCWISNLFNRSAWVAATRDEPLLRYLGAWYCGQTSCQTRSASVSRQKSGRTVEPRKEPVHYI